MKIRTKIATEAKADWDNLSNWLSNYGTLGTKAIDTFKQNRDRLKLEERDLYYWIKKKDPEDFIYAMRDVRNQNEEKTLKKKLVDETRKLVAENKDWKVYRIESHDAGQLMGKGTKWCITMDDDHYWNKYKNDSYDFYFFIRKKPKEDRFDKIALQYDANSNFVEAFWDVTDLSYEKLPSSLGVPTNFDGIDISSEIYDFKKYEIFEYNEDSKLPIRARSFVKYVKVSEDVETIRPRMFFNCENLKEIDCKNIKKIEEDAFKACKNLKKVIFNNVKYIGFGAFQDCINLEEIYLPDSLKIIEMSAFRNCKSLVKVSLNPRTIGLISNYSFSGCPDDMILEVRGTRRDWMQLVLDKNRFYSYNFALEEAIKEYEGAISL